MTGADILKRARAAARGIEDDISDRAGIGDALDVIDAATRRRMRDVWIKIICLEFAKGEPLGSDGLARGLAPKADTLDVDPFEEE